MRGAVEALVLEQQLRHRVHVVQDALLILLCHDTEALCEPLSPISAWILQRRNNTSDGGKGTHPLVSCVENSVRHLDQLLPHLLQLTQRLHYSK